MERQAKTDAFVPAFPTIGPELLVRMNRSAQPYPLGVPGVRYFYFARNAIWHTAKILGLDKGEVLVPAYHHGVEIEALVDAGAAVKFYRIDGKLDVDFPDIERKITPRTTALYLTHFAGFPGPVYEMKKLAEKYGLPLIEDCALSLLSKDGDVPLGITGDVAIFCLYKVLPVPDGGALIFNRAAGCDLQDLPPPSASTTFSIISSSLLRNMALRGGRAGRVLRKLALSMGKGAMQSSGIKPVLPGSQHFDPRNVNLGMSRLTKRLLLLFDAAEIAERRRRNYLYLQYRLCDIAPPLFESLPPGNVPLFYPLLVENNQATVQRLASRGIEAVDFWRAFHPACDPREFPEVAKLRSSVVEIPCHQDLTLMTMAKVVGAVRDVLKDKPRRRLSQSPRVGETRDYAV